jgi:hypothetical protein
LSICLTAQVGAADQNDQKGIDFFEKKIRPVLVARCYECHSAQAKILKGGLRLDHREAVLAGGDSGVAIVPGDPDASRLVQALRYKDPDLRMPPTGRLPDHVVADFVEWIRQGAFDPREVAPVEARKTKKGIDYEKAREFWAFRPPQSVPLPAVDDDSWIDSPIDRFILSRLEEERLKPAPPLDRRLLLRRVTYDLIGLPPTTAETEAFLADDRPGAFARVVDRLLASPRYGEKWGRYWLDVARYADSNGMDENLAFVNAFRYRDWVVQAMNKDKPYDRFAQEQIAGDLLVADSMSRAEKNGLVTATGFLSIGPKMLACDDGHKMELDIIDEQVSTTSQVFLGLSVGCARCHDHKFDPISTVDYYSLAGIFKSTKTMENFNVVAVWHEHSVASDEVARQLEENRTKATVVEQAIETILPAQRDRILSRERGRAGRYLRAVYDYHRGVGRVPVNGSAMVGDLLQDSEQVLLTQAEDFQRGTLTPTADGHGEGIGVLLHQGYAEYDVTIAEAGRHQFEIRYAAAAARPMRLLVDGQLVAGDVAGEVTGGWNPEHQRWYRETVLELAAGQHTVRLERLSGPVPHVDRWLLVALEAANENDLRTGFFRQWHDYLVKLDKEPSLLASLLGSDSALDLPTKLTDEIVENLVRRFDSAQAAWVEAVTANPSATMLEDEKLELVRRVLHDPAGPFAMGEHPELYFDTELRDRVEDLRAQRREIDANRPIVPLAMGVREGKLESLRVHLRGDYLTLGAETSRRLPSVFDLPDANIPENTSGRLELARWIASPDNPLSARVLVNRVWLWHFGEGLFRTPDNVGQLGEPPTHPGLLDWLSRDFVARGWSLKRLHRRILLSSTYRMSSAHDDRAYAVDPDNRFWWRIPRRRLHVEELRDTLLALGGRLDLTMYGQLLTFKARQYVSTFGSNQLDTADLPRRSIYLPVMRSATYPIYQTFDFPDPSVSVGRRVSTTIAPQSLFLMNSKLVLGETLRLAEEASRRTDERFRDDREPVRLLYRRILGREPTLGELDSSLVFVENYAQALRDEASDSKETQESDRIRLLAYRGLGRTLVASNEFLYIE